MPTSSNWSSTSAICRLEWRPSAGVALALGALGLLAAIAVIASEAPRAVAWPLALAAVADGTWLAARHWRAPVRQLCWIAGRSPELDGAELAAATLQWRGPLAFLRWRDADGRTQRLAWWPDTLPRHARRELKLVALAAVDMPATASMAP